MTNEIIRLNYSDFDKLECIKQNFYKDKNGRILKVVEILEDYKIVKMVVV